jgi:hypothetical protein
VKQRNTDILLPGMTRINVTIDNYDPLVGYTPAGAWHAPDPSAFEGGRGASSLTPGSSIRADIVDTYHSTTVFGAKASINFTGEAFTYSTLLVHMSVYLCILWGDGRSPSMRDSLPFPC